MASGVYAAGEDTKPEKKWGRDRFLPTNFAFLDDGGFLALHRKCTHLGCTVPWNRAENRFVCPCHASAFDLAGDVVSAPASRAVSITVSSSPSASR